MRARMHALFLLFLPPFSPFLSSLSRDKRLAPSTCNRRLLSLSLSLSRSPSCPEYPFSVVPAARGKRAERNVASDQIKARVFPDIEP